MGYSLPSLTTHRKVYEVLGLSTSICGGVDRLVDVEPPLIREVEPSWQGGERLWRDFGYRKTEFPLMYCYVYRRFGLEGVKCLVVHYVLDHVEGLLYKGFDSEMSRDEVTALIYSYIDECRTSREEVLSEAVNNLVRILDELMRRFDDLVNAVKGEVDLRLLPVDVIVNASSDLIGIRVRAVLISRGYRGRSGFTVSRSAFDKYMQLYNRAKQLLRQKLNEAIVNHEIADPQGLLESINNVKKRSSTEARTIVDVMRIIEEEGSKNREFHKLLELIGESVKEATEALQL